jgi:Flp pilus assembly protein TadG
MIRSEGGTVAIYFALCLTAIISVVGFTIDFSSAHRTKNLAQGALDASTLAAATSLRLSKTDYQKVGTDNWDINFTNQSGKGAIEQIDALEFSLDNGIIESRARITVMNYFGGLIGNPTTTVEVTSAAGFSGGLSGEIAIVTDISSSMNGEMNALRKGVSDTLETLIPDDSNPDNLSIAIIPFGGSVNITNYGTTWFKSGEIPGTPGAPNDDDGAFNKVGQHGITPRAGDKCRHEVYDKDFPRLCSARRSGSAQVDDTPPSSAPFDFFDFNVKSCPVARMQGLTTDKATLKQVSENLCYSWGTNGGDAMSWAWRALSPRWQGLWGQPGSPMDYDESAQKTVIFFTDGRNTPWTFTTGLQQSDANKEMLKTCELMKAKGIEIYAITYRVNNTVKQLLRECATKPDYVLHPANVPSMVAAFEQLSYAVKNSQVRLMK